VTGYFGSGRGESSVLFGGGWNGYALRLEEKGSIVTSSTFLTANSVSVIKIQEYKILRPFIPVVFLDNKNNSRYGRKQQFVYRVIN